MNRRFNNVENARFCRERGRKFNRERSESLFFVCLIKKKKKEMLGGGEIYTPFNNTPYPSTYFYSPFVRYTDPFLFLMYPGLLHAIIFGEKTWTKTCYPILNSPPIFVYIYIYPSYSLIIYFLHQFLRIFSFLLVLDEIEKKRNLFSKIEIRSEREGGG